MTKWAYLLVAASYLAACSRTETAGEPIGDAESNATESLEGDDVADANAGAPDATPSEDCPKLDIQWHAEVGAKDGQRMLFVTGEGMVTSGGWHFSLTPGALDKKFPPIQHFSLTIQQPSGPATQPVLPFKVEAETLAQPRYEAVVIDCGTMEYARITQIDRP